MEANEGERRAGLADALGRLRHLKDSKLENQKAPAQLLVAIEATLAERGDEAGPTQYFLALESLLAANDDDKSPVYASSVYLLSVILPFVAQGVVRAKSNALLAAVAQPLGDPHGGENANARLRAALGCIEVFLDAVPASDRAMLENDATWRTVWDLVLQLCVDARPKVRRRAHELVSHALALPQWKGAHPYAVRTVQWAASVLASVAAARGLSHTKPANAAPEFDKKAGKAKHAMSAAALRQQHAAEGSASTGIWVCALLKMIAQDIPPKCAAPLVKELLHLPSLQNPFLTVAVFDVFSSLFATHTASADSARAHVAALNAPAAEQKAAPDAAMLQETVAALRNPDIVPPHTDVQTLPSYFALLEACMVAYARLGDGSEAWRLVPQAWDDILALGLSAKSDASRNAQEVRTAARNAMLALLRYCIPDAAVLEAQTSKKAPFAKLIASLKDALGRHALHYGHSRADILAVLAGLVSRLRYAPAPGAMPAAESLTMDLVEDVAVLRSQKGFDARPEADLVLGAAIEACGPEAFLARLPLLLLDENKRPNTKGTGRAWLLPLLREHITNTNLGHFVTELVPLSEALFELRVACETNGAKPVEAKVFEALIDQIWACFPAYCELARDVDTALTPQFLELLLNVLRTQSALRPSVLKGLELLVQRSTALAASTAPPAQLTRQFGVDQAAGKRFLAHLQAMSGTLLAALFNLLAELPAQARGYVMECISTYLGILDAESLAQTFAKVAQMLEQSLQDYTPGVQPGAPEPNSPRYVPPLPHTMLDLLIALVPFVRGANATALYDLVSSDALLSVTDGGLQKKVYRVLARLIAGADSATVLRHAGKSDSVSGGAAALLVRLGKHTEAVQPGAVRDRLLLLDALAPQIAEGELHILGAIVPEAVLGTKEANQRAREAAYALLVAIGHRMDQGGRLRRPDGEVDASANEYIMMVAAGLAGASPRMISASITALARLLYEFHTQLPAETLDELLSTMVVYLESTNREIIKSALGFSKVSIVVLDTPRIARSLAQLVPALIGVQIVHKNHFKGRVRHMIERLIRRFGVPAVERHVDEDNKRLITNIRKRKERAKRKKSAQGEDIGTDSFQPATGAGSMDAFEEALYGSASESESDDEEEAPARGRGRGRPDRGRPDRRRNREEESYLVEDNDTPLDLLDRGATAVRGHERRRKERHPGEEASKVDVADDGRLRFEEKKAADDDQAPVQDDIGVGRAYLEKSMGVDGFTHGRGGVVKFNKNTKRTRANERMDEDEDPSSAPAPSKRPKAKRQAVGQEFRARRAQGDVQKNGMSPYAYVPLSSVTGKKNARQARNLQITGKGRK